MDVLIKGLPLPQEGEYDYHLTIRSDGKVEGTQQVGERIHSIHTWAIELPEHGDLISKASVLSLLRYYCDMREYKKDVRCEDCENRNACVVRPIMDEVNKLDTVLEAST